MLAACDCEIFGKSLEDSEVVLNIGGSFYDGAEVTEEEFCMMLTQATSANLVGERVVGIAIKNGDIDPSNVRVIDGVPHAMLFCM